MDDVGGERGGGNIRRWAAKQKDPEDFIKVAESSDPKTLLPQKGAPNTKSKRALNHLQFYKGNASLGHAAGSGASYTSHHALIFVEVFVVLSKFTQDARRDAQANWNVFPLMLFASSVNTPIHINRSHLLVLRVRVLCEFGLKLWARAAQPRRWYNACFFGLLLLLFFFFFFCQDKATQNMSYSFAGDAFDSTSGRVFRLKEKRKR